MTNPFNKVLCKRTSTSGKPFWWDDYVEPPGHPKRHDCENRMFIEGTWYEITKWKDNSFWVIDSQGNSHAHKVYSEEDKANFPSHCDLHGPGDYAKWFYTPEELIQVEAGTYKMSFKEKNAISVFVGNYHWVKQKDIDGGELVIALCIMKGDVHGTHCWVIMNSEVLWKDHYFDYIGHQVDSMETQEENRGRIENLEELNDTIIPLIDSLRVEGTEDAKWHAPVEYHKPLVRKAVDRYFEKSFEKFKDSDLFF